MVESRCRIAVSDKEQLEIKTAELEKEKKSNEKKLSHQQTRLTKLTVELKEEKEVSDRFTESTRNSTSLFDFCHCR